MSRTSRSSTVERSHDWSEFIASLSRHRVRFIIVGAHALAVLGRPRYTGDLDVFIDPTLDNSQRLANAFRDFGFDGAADEAWQLAQPGKMMTLGREPCRIDVTTDMTDLTFQEAWQGRIKRRIGRHLVSFLGREQYIKNKLASSQRPVRRAKDLKDLEMLEEVPTKKRGSKKRRSKKRPSRISSRKTRTRR